MSRREWLEERLVLLELEKKHKRDSDALAKKRRELPWVKIDADYRFARGLEPMNATYGILDLTPKGRDEDDLEWSMAWLKRLAEL